MNSKMVGKYFGYLLWAEGVFLLPAAGISGLYRESGAVYSLLIAAGLCGILGLALFFACRSAAGSLYARESFVVAGGGWLLISLMGALPFYISGHIPSFIDAFFESVSGFTTTGASILNEVESLPNGLLFWRCFINWLGGIGILVFILAVVRSQKGAGFTLHLLRAESAGPQVGKLRAKTRDSVRMLFLIYGSLTALCFLTLLVAGMPLFDSLCTALATAGTGGFGIKNDSIAYYAPHLQAIVGIFMALFGVNFGLFALLLRRQFKAVAKDAELRLYILILFISTGAIAFSLFVYSGFTLGQSLHQSAFTVSSVLTTTGFSLSNFDLWPQFSRSLLMVLMLFGGMAGSTAGGFKISRMLILGKSMQAGMHRLLHPRSVRMVKINGKTLDEEVIRGTYLFLSVYCGIALFSFVLVSADGFTLETNISAVISALNNIGPGLGEVGPSASFAAYSALSKLVLIFNMLVGRLEIFPILLLLSPTTWRRKA